MSIFGLPVGRMPDYIQKNVCGKPKETSPSHHFMGALYKPSQMDPIFVGLWRWVSHRFPGENLQCVKVKSHGNHNLLRRRIYL